jgi:hypothetical protein
MARLQVLVSAEEKETFREIARREGVSLSAWFRQAGLARLAEGGRRRRIDTIADLLEFFGECDEREVGEEPSWEEHRRVIDNSVRGGAGDA